MFDCTVYCVCRCRLDLILKYNVLLCRLDLIVKYNVLLCVLQTGLSRRDRLRALLEGPLPRARPARPDGRELDHREPRARLSVHALSLRPRAARRRARALPRQLCRDAPPHSPAHPARAAALARARRRRTASLRTADGTSLSAGRRGRGRVRTSHVHGVHADVLDGRTDGLCRQNAPLDAAAAAAAAAEHVALRRPAVLDGRSSWSRAWWTPRRPVCRSDRAAAGRALGHRAGRPGRRGRPDAVRDGRSEQHVALPARRRTAAAQPQRRSIGRRAAPPPTTLKPPAFTRIHHGEFTQTMNFRFLFTDSSISITPHPTPTTSMLSFFPIYKRDSTSSLLFIDFLLF